MQVTVGCAIVVDNKYCEKTGMDAAKLALDNGVAHHWWRDVAEKGHDPFEEMLALFDAADAIVAFNGLEFDFPLLKRHYAHNMARYMSHRIKCLDPFNRIRAATTRWPKLDTLLVANNLTSKSGDGKRAIRLWEESRRDELHAYCADDVRLLLQLAMLDTLHFPDVGTLPNHVGGIASFLKSL
jgi:hypothetical protein